MGDGGGRTRRCASRAGVLPSFRSDPMLPPMLQALVFPCTRYSCRQHLHHVQVVPGATGAGRNAALEAHGCIAIMDTCQGQHVPPGAAGGHLTSAGSFGCVAASRLGGTEAPELRRRFANEVQMVVVVVVKRDGVIHPWMDGPKLGGEVLHTLRDTERAGETTCSAVAVPSRANNLTDADTAHSPSFLHPPILGLGHSLIRIPPHLSSSPWGAGTRTSRYSAPARCHACPTLNAGTRGT